jgi:hypothetical protein
MSQLTLAEAAREVRLSKASVWRAIKSGRLSASRQEDGTYRVDMAELIRAFPPEPVKPVRDAAVKQPEPAANGPLVAAKDELIAELRARIASADARAAELIDERNHWRTLAERIALPGPTAKRGLMGRLFKRG